MNVLADHTRQDDDDCSSTASFEDVSPGMSSAKKSQVVVRERKETAEEKADEDVPDVLYYVYYRSADGRVSHHRKADKPIDVTATDPQTGEGTQGAKKPVLEIITRVTACYANRHAPPPPPPSYYRPPPPRGRRDTFVDYGYDSESSEERDYPVPSDVSITKVETTEMVLHSKHLRNALSAVVNYYPGVDFLSDRVIVEAPYRILVHHIAELERYKHNQPRVHDTEYAELTTKHIDVLLTFLRTTLGAQLDEEYARWSHSTPTATFENFWLLLKPGSVIYRKMEGHWTPFVISRVASGNSNHHGRRGAYSDAYLIDCWNIEFVDGRIERMMQSFHMHPFTGEQAIHSLPVIPARFFPGGEKAITEKQIALGKTYWELSKRPSYKEYDGPLVGRDGCPTGNLKGRVIVDCEGYDKFRDHETSRGRVGHHRVVSPRRGLAPPPEPIPPKDQLPLFYPRCQCAACVKSVDKKSQSGGPFAGFEDLNPNVDSPPSNDLFFHVLTDTIPAFLLSERRWAMLQVEDLAEVRPDREAFKYLVLDDDIKLTVKSLIGKFASEDGKVSPWPSDFVANKGVGRIFLLHGSPGVGKTCTAECIAELTRRPLLSLTSGDISTSMSASSVERNLSYFLELGERYGALVLLDEADVYLEERRTKDLHRNGLVSIFLRALEYYKGVLFLTTNRVAAFDTAFTSRIHVALHYKKLTDADRMRVWTNNFERLERDSGGKCHVPLSTREYAYGSEEMRDLKWNGREIRNGLQTAVALAETEALEDGVEKVTVTDKHLRAVVKMSRGFKEFLRGKRGWETEDDDEEEEDAESEGSSYSGD
jgi:hypothetical protein